MKFPQIQSFCKVSLKVDFFFSLMTVFSDPRWTKPDQISINSQILNAVTPKMSLLITYPYLLTSMRVSVFKELAREPMNGRRLRNVTACFRHGSSLVSNFGISSLYRGAELHLVHSLLKTQISSITRKRISSPKLATLTRYMGDAAIYPLSVACARIIAHTKGDSGDWSVLDAFRDTLSYDGVFGLWAGLGPFLMANVAEDLIGQTMEVFRERFPVHDAADEGIAYASLIAFSAVATAPLLSISNVMRCQGNSPFFADPQSFGEIGRELDWKGYGLMLAMITSLCGVNYLLIDAKHRANDEDASFDDYSSFCSSSSAMSHRYFEANLNHAKSLADYEEAADFVKHLIETRQIDFILEFKSARRKTGKFLELLDKKRDLHDSTRHDAEEDSTVTSLQIRGITENLREWIEKYVNLNCSY
jgi:hypothetical protein